MKHLVKLFFASLFAMLGTLVVQAQPEEFAGKIINLGSNATTLEAGKWYVLFNVSTSSYVLEGAGNTLGLTTSSPNNTDAQTNAGYLVQLEETGTENQYYLKSGLGNYYANVNTSQNNGTNPRVQAKYYYTITQLGTTAGHWSLRSIGRYYLQSNNGSLIGSSSSGSAGGDRDWAFREVSFTDVGNLTGKPYVNYILGSKNIVRLTSRRNTSVRLSDNGTNTVGASKNDNTLAQVWLLSKSGSGYTLRNANTGRYLNDDNNFRSPSATANTIYIQFSPNNGTNGAYINLSEKEDFSGSSCLNLGNDGTTLYKWSCQGDQGCDWSIALAENFTMQEVEDKLFSLSGLSEPVAGKYYRIKNIGYSKYVTENVGANVLTCASKDADKLSQYWTLVQSGNRWCIQNLCTQRYITQQNGAFSKQYTTTTAKTSSFAIQRTDDATLQSYYILDSGNVGLHCDASSVVVGWYSNNDNSVWGFEEVQLDDAFIEAGRAQLNAYNDLVQHLSTYKAKLANLFQDKACTVLKDEIQALSDEALAENADYAYLNDDMKAMVLKVKNNTWESFAASNGYQREGFEKFFRVRDDYYVYSNNQKMSWNEYAGMSNAFGKLSGPTGIVGKAGDIIYIYVDEEHNADCTLQVEVVMDSESPGDHQTGSTTNLHAGLNTVLLSQPSTIYIFYQLNDPEKYLANYPAAKIHIEGGELQGYFDYTRGMTNQDWTLLYEKMLNKSQVVNLKCDRIVFAMLTNLVKNAIGKTGEAEGLMRVWNNFIECEEDLMGFKEDLQGRFRNIWNAFSVNHGYMYSTTYGTYYEDGTISTVMNYNTLTSSGGAIWGPSHEFGHNLQACFNIVGATEVSNNLFSNVNVFLQGVSTTRGTKVTDTLEDFAKGKGWFGMSIWEQTRFYFQLYLYFHAQGHKPDFYPTLFKMLRQDPIQKRTGPSDATLTDGDGNVVGGRITYGKTDYLHMAKKMCDAAQLDLSELFEVNGMFVPYDKFFIGDYSNYWVTTTQQDIEEAKAYMHRYPKAPSICFIDDRIKPSPAIFNSPLEGKPKGQNRVAYDDGEVPIGYADVGQWSDFVNEYQTNGYYYTTATSSGVTTYTINGSGAIGFKVYDKDGNLVYLSNKKKFTIPSNVQAKIKDGFKMVACEANGYEVLVPYGPALYRGEMTAYYEGDPTPHTLYYYGTGTAGKSEMNPLPANSIAYVKPDQTDKKQPTEGLLANMNVVGPDSTAQTLVIDGDKPFYIPTEFTAANIAFTKSGEGYQALRLPFNTWSGLGIVNEDGTVNEGIKTFAAGEPVLFKDKVSITQEGMTVKAGTYAKTESGYILDPNVVPNKTSTVQLIYAENISPFTYVWDETDGIHEIDKGQETRDKGQETRDKGQQSIYNIAGQRVSKPTKGLYIVGGKKVLVK